MLRHTASKVRDSPGPLARNPRRGIGMWAWLLQIYAEIGDMVFDSDCQTDQIRKALKGWGPSLGISAVVFPRTIKLGGSDLMSGLIS